MWHLKICFLKSTSGAIRRHKHLLNKRCQIFVLNKKTRTKNCNFKNKNWIRTVYWIVLQLNIWSLQIYYLRFSIRVEKKAFERTGFTKIASYANFFEDKKYHNHNSQRNFNCKVTLRQVFFRLRPPPLLGFCLWWCSNFVDFVYSVYTALWHKEGGGEVK